MLAVVLITGAVIFFTLFEQAGSSLSLFADRNVNLDLIGAAKASRRPSASFFGTPASWPPRAATPARSVRRHGLHRAQTQSFNAGFILIFAPVFATLWTLLGQAQHGPDGPMLKFGARPAAGRPRLPGGGLGAGMANASLPHAAVLLGLLYLLHTTGELCLSPVGLSEITKLSMPGGQRP
jgi:POT family proton-dependent oligopeptide transporter